MGRIQEAIKQRAGGVTEDNWFDLGLKFAGVRKKAYSAFRARGLNAKDANGKWNMSTKRVGTGKFAGVSG